MKNVTTLPIADGKYTLTTYTNDQNKPCAKLETVKGRKCWAYHFRNEEDRDDYAVKMCERIEASEMERAENIAKAKAERDAKLANLKEGDIFYTSWGYEQTNIDFYKVVKISGQRITVRRLAQQTRETGFMSGYTAPRGEFHPQFPEEIRVGLNKWGGFAIKGHYTELWDGKEKGCSWYA